MLRSLYIRNYALIEEFTVEFDRGLNIITGETGAGKSIVLGAFSLLIGERASAEIVRKGTDKAVVEAEFQISGNARLEKYLAEREIDYSDDALIVRREVSAKGTSRAFVNDSPVPTQVLKELGNFVVDLHGQHEHQSLLRQENHVSMLDDYGGLSELVHDFQFQRARILRLDREIEELKQRERKLRDERDLYEFQLTEIVAVNPLDSEDESIDAELRVLENSEELRDSAHEIYQSLYEEDGSAIERLGTVREMLDHLRSIDSSLEEPYAEATSALAIVSELAKYLDHYATSVSLDPSRLSELRDRLQQLQRLKKKYGGTLEAVLNRKVDLESKLSFADEFTESIATLEEEQSALRVTLSVAAERLSAERASLSRTLEPAIVEVLKDLGIEHGSFAIQSTLKDAIPGAPGITVAIGNRQVQTNSQGVDTIEFYLSTNAGEPVKPLVRVASGGEISRVMLALKTILAHNDRLPLLVFDEIDVGISGRIAQRVGRAMKNLANDHQIIAITHLAQIGAFADAHFVVEKTMSREQTTSQLRRLSDAEHLEEVARLISGDIVSESSLGNARVLIEEASASTTRTTRVRKSNVVQQ